MRREKEIRGSQIETDEVELFADEMLLSVEKPKECTYTHKPIATDRLIQQDGSIRGQYINDMYFCTLETSKESKKTILFIIAPKTTKSLGI